ncbi:phosphoribosyl-ATP diphosphatase [Listeria monocytogenes]|nr:phosphoribosyl-ATP diphosphatase [Listeria monocytogenes]EAH1011498.1 phosphoribosyl-ATP diphosphatase [Listeria monocytogenes]EAH1534454.1 phosphoribosyl-ATP diphosphatase [Listeria monocytogenes]EAH2028801.1 phosphoribosyl-ATP diphosphatase [Listeria monocytogenes]EAH3108076.1 phosphoribosyl-ATP diphosphatase [Listeria monocytogenes]
MLNDLYEEIKLRKTQPREGSYTNYLFDKGLDKILKKVGEEATEVVIAAKNNEQELIAEVSDLTYHLLVLLAEQNIPLSKIQAELQNREGKLSTTRDRKEINNL